MKQLRQWMYPLSLRLEVILCDPNVKRILHVLFGYHQWKKDSKRFDQLPVYAWRLLGETTSNLDFCGL